MKKLKNPTLIERAGGFLPPAHIPRCSVSDIFSEMIDSLNPPFGVDFLYIKGSFL